MCTCFTCPSPRKAMIILNAVFLVFACLLLALGIWSLTDKNFKNLATIRKTGAPDPFISTAAAVMVTIGTISLVISLFGLCGAIAQNEECVFFYVVILVILLTGECTAGLMFALFSEELKTGFETKVQTYFINHYHRGDAKFFSTWNFLMYDFQCCGVVDYTDFQTSYWYNKSRFTDGNGNNTVPQVCCKVNTSAGYSTKSNTPNQFSISANTYWPKVDNITARNNKLCQQQAMNTNGSKFTELNNQGCYTSLLDYLNRRMWVIAILLTFIGTVQLTGLISGCIFRRQVLDVTFGDVGYHKKNDELARLAK